RRPESMTDRQFTKLVAAEFCIQSTLRHPHLLRVVDLVRFSTDRWGQILEYCPGGDLHDRIRLGPLSYEEAGGILKQLLTGITYMHRLGVAHRDIKPENILFDAAGCVKIADFGSAEVFRQCWETRSNKTRGQAGSRPYMGPETFTGCWYDARKADIWSCGIVYASMILGQVPWQQADTARDTLYRAFTIA
ncbi:kinase-like domain-containing protein, partial [Thamnocephalis sphaerospora]